MCLQLATADPVTQLVKSMQRVLDLRIPRLGISLEFLRTPVPDDPVALFRRLRCLHGLEDVRRIVLPAKVRPFPDHFPGHVVGQDPLLELSVLLPRARQDRDEVAAAAADVPHVLPGAQLAIRHVHERGVAHQLAQDFPGADVRLVVGDVPVIHVVMHGDSTVVGDRQCPHQLLQVGTVVLVVSVDDLQTWSTA